ncbi:uncharacterized protein AMSG_02465 [Thecamonas trahens ATCC 50062]|uniref:FH2 domain-containing protein n=1 Tax=Thecamonas trahens ATCC 50062 TaxID=461836 RepID=A0A0L0D814_THETB|nr:hypothetical protein AMSG_02465 [Thecamonas trahens ATCC 50062]KNC47448.1 hypothetical protein AMSG_02465 [Thecamonas trahens ATCC 50062]|eukprot:XP_013759384.1 hypothetical protein AMSG_02465 [Thecamonas trahens ATCC 50062]
MPGSGGLKGAGGTKPKKKMRAVQWKKLPPRLVGRTVWYEIKPDAFELEASDVEEYFGVTEAKKAKPVQAAGTASKVVSLLEGRRPMNIDIALRRINKTPDQIRELLLAPDPTVLKNEFLAELLKMLPTDLERTLFSEYEGEASALSIADQSVMALMSVPMVESRIRNYMAIDEFDEAAIDITDSLATVQLACDQVLASRGLRSLMGAVLVVGNYCNKGTPRGGSKGFKFSSLAKIMTTRSGVSSKFTLMDYAVRLLHSSGLVEDDFPLSDNESEAGEDDTAGEAEQVEMAGESTSSGKLPLMWPTSELSAVKAAASVSVAQIESYVVELANKAEVIYKEFETLTDPEADDVTADEAYTNFLDSFLSLALERLSDLYGALDEVKASFDEVLEFMAGDQKPLPTIQAFFQELTAIIDAYGKAEFQWVNDRPRTAKTGDSVSRAASPLTVAEHNSEEVSMRKALLADQLKARRGGMNNTESSDWDDEDDGDAAGRAEPESVRDAVAHAIAAAAATLPSASGSAAGASWESSGYD